MTCIERARTWPYTMFLFPAAHKRTCDSLRVQDLDLPLISTILNVTTEREKIFIPGRRVKALV